ncbi:MAG: trypsin-like peptidase domain-containing protein [Planctomycetes bacterium]|nr:trypsin-like peptidase domain-containing protein [Planctomycetota bacterium]
MKRTLTYLFLGFCAFAGGITGTLFLQNSSLVGADTKNAPPPPPPAAVVTASGGTVDRFEQVIQKISASVVSIEAIKPPATTPNGRSSGKPVEESGSGVIVRFEGVRGAIVITNNHVISSAKADQITVHLADNRLYHPSQVWADPESDIAALRIDVENLPAAPVGDSERARVGQWVLAFGSPFGLNQTVTQGIISARERGQVSLGSTIRIKDFLQTDAAINPGSSGGPLVNLDGEVIGINTAIASHSGSNSGVAFSIPINLVKRIVKQLIETGAVTRGYLGVHLSQTMEPADALKLGMDRVQGALVESVYPESPAAIAGLRNNDVVLQVDGISIRNENHLINLISALPAGQKVKLQVWRERKNVLVEVSVGDWNRAQSKLKSSKD